MDHRLVLALYFVWLSDLPILKPEKTHLNSAGKQLPPHQTKP
jgi:hypothetical protein